jgi:CheY-like chemotaxis protein
MKRILVIEDDEALRDDLAELLGAAGFAVEVAADGPSGLRRLLGSPPDLVLCDRVMPQMSGQELLEIVRRERPDLRAMPFVFLTALNDVRDRHAIDGLAPTLYLGKPIDHDALLRILGDLLATPR